MLIKSINIVFLDESGLDVHLHDLDPMKQSTSPEMEEDYAWVEIYLKFYSLSCVSIVLNHFAHD